MPVALSAIAVACVGTFLVGIATRSLARRIGLVDRPDGHRKLHSGSTPLGGGIAVFLVTAATIVALYFLSDTWRPVLAPSVDTLLALLAASALIVALGTTDDRLALRGRHKIAGQLAAAGVLIASGLTIHKIGLFGWDFDLGLFAVPFTLFWLLGAVNAVNMLDGIDGLATVVGMILVATIAVMGVMTDRLHVAVVAAVFGGSLLGFLRLNFPPATIFLGDAGSMLIGLVVGTLAILGSYKGPGTVLLAAPLAVWTIPIFDSAAAILRRKLTGRSIYTTDRGHLHHRLLDLLGSNRKVIALVAVCCLFTSAAALWSVLSKSDLIALVSVAAVVGIFVATGIFGRVEMILLASRLRDVGLSIIPVSASKRTNGRQTTLRLQGSRKWEMLWGTLVESAGELGLSEICLDVNLPAAQEGYHASWRQTPDGTMHQRLRVDVPLMLRGSSIGRLTIVGNRSQTSLRRDIQRLLEVVDRFEAGLHALAAPQSETPHFDGPQQLPGPRRDRAAGRRANAEQLAG